MSDKNSILIRRNSIFLPPPLKKGDKVAIISPASAVKDEYVFGAMERFMERGYEPILMPYALGHESGSFAASKSDRLMDLLDVIQDEEIKAVFCSRGGYGCAQLLPNFSYNLIASHPKWVIGFSDVSALLALMYSSDVASIHGPMAKHLATSGDNDSFSEALLRILQNGGKFDIALTTNELSRHGKARGTLVGGNFAVLNSLASTPYDILKVEEGEDVILFLEDISEAIYEVERMLSRLGMAGTLHKIKGLILGNFSEYKPDKNFLTMEQMADSFLRRFNINNIPVAFSFPTGHSPENYPLVEGAEVELEITPQFTRLKTIEH